MTTQSNVIITFILSTFLVSLFAMFNGIKLFKMIYQYIVHFRTACRCFSNSFTFLCKIWHLKRFFQEKWNKQKFSFVNNYSARAKLLILNIDASIMLPTSRIYFNSKCLDSIQIKMNCYVTNRVHYTTKSRLKEKLLASFFT